MQIVIHVTIIKVLSLKVHINENNDEKKNLSFLTKSSLGECLEFTF